MLNLDSKIAAFKVFLDILTWKKIGQIALLLFVIGIGWALYENTEQLTNFFKTQKISTKQVDFLNRTTVSRLNSIIMETDAILGMHIATVDFKSNTRTVVYGKFNNEELEKMYINFSDRNIDSKIPLFNDDEINNTRIISLINGEFSCYKYKDSIAARLAPEGIHIVDTTCSLGIPPFYGRFSGIVTVYLRNDPTSVEKDQIRTFLKGISEMVYQLNFADDS